MDPDLRAALQRAPGIITSEGQLPQAQGMMLSLDWLSLGCLRIGRAGMLATAEMRNEPERWQSLCHLSPHQPAGEQASAKPCLTWSHCQEVMKGVKTGVGGGGGGNMGFEMTTKLIANYLPKLSKVCASADIQTNC